MKLNVTERCFKWLADKGYSNLFGAREVARVIQDKIKTFFVDEVLFGELSKGGTVRADIAKDDVKLKIRKKAIKKQI